MTSPARDEFTATMVVLFGERFAADPHLMALLDRMILEEASAYAESYRAEAESRIQSANSQLAAQRDEYDKALEDFREQARNGMMGNTEDARANIEELTRQRDELQATLDGLADRIRDAQSAARTQLEQEQARVTELETQLSDAHAQLTKLSASTFEPAQAAALTDAIGEAMEAYRARADAITAENEAVARNEDAKLTAALRKAFHAISHQK